MTIVKERPMSEAVAFKSEPKSEPRIKNAATIGWFQQCVHRSRNEIFSEVKTVTPAMAEVILQNNEDNRSIRPSKFNQMVSDMENGRWTLNGEGIIIAKTGELNDGQHRLKALIAAKVSVPMLFVFGVERESRTTVDQGASRSAGDYLSMSGMVYGSRLAAVARKLIAFERTKRTSFGRISDIAAAETVERVKKDPTIMTSVRYAAGHARAVRFLTNPTVVAFCHNVLLSKNATEGLAFLEMFCTGLELQRHDPAFKAREKLLNLKSKSDAVAIEVILRAWNAYREKRQMTMIPVHGRLPELV